MSPSHEADAQPFLYQAKMIQIFVVQCNLGPIEGTPPAKTRANCTQDYIAYGQIQFKSQKSHFSAFC